jgi:HEAT repeat protein
LRGGEEELKSEDAGLRLAAVTRLDRYVPDDDWEVRSVGRHREAADESNDEEVRIKALLGGLDDPEPAAVIRSLRSMREFRLWDVPRPVLRKLLESPETAMRREAWGLAQWRVSWSEDDRDDLPWSESLERIDSALDDPDFVVRANAVSCLTNLVECWSEELEGPGLAAVFRKALSDDSEHIRHDALFALTSYERGLPELVPDLIRLLDEDPRYSTEALGILGDAAKDAVPKLRELLGNTEARLQAAEAIRKINGDLEPLFAVVRESVAEGKPQGIYELGQLGSRARPLVPEVVRALAHENRWARAVAAEALGEIGGELALDALLQRLAAEKDKRVLAKVDLALERLARRD